VEAVVVGGQWRLSSSVDSGGCRRRWTVEAVVVGGQWRLSSSVVVGPVVGRITASVALGVSSREDDPTDPTSRG
jgi:hypothetical protein